MDESFLKIDADRLDLEWMEQPLLLYRYSAQLADARLELDNAKAALDVMEAELENEIRKAPGEYGLVKETEKEIKSVVMRMQPYQNAVRALNKKKHAVDILWAAVNALEHRKKALENMVSLHGQQYYASPRAPGTRREPPMSTEDKKAVRSLGRKKDSE